MTIEIPDTSEEENDCSGYGWSSKADQKAEKNGDGNEYVIPRKNVYKHPEAKEDEDGVDDKPSETDYDGEDPDELYRAYYTCRKIGRVQVFFQ